MSDIFFLLTPGLTVFLSPDTAQLIAASADVTMFYSVTVLMLVGHLPFCIFVGTMLIQRQVLDQESSVTLASLLWLVLALLSVCLLIMHIVMPLPFFFHALVVICLVLGTLLRVLAILGLPYAFFANGDPLFCVTWWWLLLGIDWPDLPASSSVFVELLAIVVAAQAMHKSSLSETLQGQVIALGAPMVLRALALSDTFWVRVIFPVPAILFISLSMAQDGCAFDLNRVLSGWSSPFMFDDLENQKGE